MAPQGSSLGPRAEGSPTSVIDEKTAALVLVAATIAVAAAPHSFRHDMTVEELHDGLIPARRQAAGTATLFEHSSVRGRRHGMSSPKRG